MGWLIAALVLTGLAMMPLGLQVSYEYTGTLVRIRIGLVTFTVYPRKKKEKKAEPVSKKEEGKKKTTEETINPDLDKPETFSEKLKRLKPFIRLGIEFLNSLRKKVVVRRLSCHVVLAGGDPADLAIHYGRTWIAAGNLFAQLQRLFDIRKKDISIDCDFMGVTSQFSGRVDVAITLGRLLGLVVRYGCMVISQYVKQMKLNKGGVEV